MAFERAGSPGPPREGAQRPNVGWRGRPLENDRVGCPTNNDRLLVRPVAPLDLSRRRARGQLRIVRATLMTGPPRRDVIPKFGQWFHKHEAPSR